jgi:hypothetical protein
MPSIAHNQEVFENAKKSGTLVPTVLDAPKLPIPVADYPISPNPYLRTPLPANNVQQPDMQRVWHTGAAPQVRIPPPSITSNAVSGSQAASQAIQIVNATPASSSSGGGITSVALAVPVEFTLSGSPITPPGGTITISKANELANTVWAGPPGAGGNIPSDSYIGLTGTASSWTISANTSQVNDFAVYAEGSNAAVNSNPSGWTISFGGSSSGLGQTVAYQVVPSPGTGTASASQTQGGVAPFVTAIATFTSNGGTPAQLQTKQGNLTIGALNLAFTSNTTAGSTVIAVLLTAPQSASGSNYSVTDSQGNSYTLVGQTVQTNQGEISIFAATGVSAGACTVSVLSSPPPTSGGSLVLLEVSNLVSPSPNIPTFRDLVSADIPLLNASKIGFGKLALRNGGTNADLSSTGGTSQFVRQNSSGAALDVVQPDFSDLKGNTAATRYNNVALVSNGLPAEYATADLTAQSAAKGVTTLLNTSFAGMYRVSWVAKVTRAATTSSVLGGTSGFQVTYTDQDDSVVVVTPAWWNEGQQGTAPATAPASASLNTTQTVLSGVIVVNAKAFTNIQYQFDYTSVGGTTMQYDLHVKVEGM